VLYRWSIYLFIFGHLGSYTLKQSRNSRTSQRIYILIAIKMSALTKVTIQIKKQTRVRELQLKSGDSAWLYKPCFKPRLCKKLRCLSSLCLVVCRANYANYVIRLTPKGRLFIANIGRLRLYSVSITESWIGRVKQVRSGSQRYPKAMAQSTPRAAV